MAQSTDYRLSQPSPTGKPGFESFKSKDDGRYYFHYNSTKGIPILFSKGYSTARERTAVLNALEHHILVPRSYVEREKEDSYYFIIRASNNEEIARSKRFDSEEKRDAQIRSLQKQSSEGATKKAPGAPKAAVKKAPAKKPPAKSRTRKTSKPKPPAQTESTDPPSRFKFNLTFRRVEDDAPLLGEIEYPILKKKVAFKGLDLSTIGRFVAEYLPVEKDMSSPVATEKPELNQKLKEAGAREKELTEALEKAKAKERDLRQELQKANKKEEKPVPKPMATKEVSTTTTTVQSPKAVRQRRAIRLVARGANVEKRLPGGTFPFEIIMALTTAEKEQVFSVFDAHIRLKSAERGNVVPIGNFYGNVPMDGHIRIPVNATLPLAGLYRLSVTVILRDPADPDRSMELEGTELIQFQ